jgi:hypothetical protein
MNVLWRIVFVFALLAPAAEAHDWYEALRAPDGSACCNGHDCERVSVRTNDETGDQELLLGESWTKVDWAKVLPDPSPDSKAHACWWRSWEGNDRMTPVVRCIIMPGLS